MFKHILIPFDGSDASRKAAALAARIAAASNAKATLLTVAEVSHAVAESFFFPFFAAPVVFPVRDEETRLHIIEGCQKGLQSLRDELFDPSLDITLEARIGRPFDEILDLVRTASVDLLVVGACGHGSLGDALLGSVSDRLAHAAPCPVLIAR